MDIAEINSTLERADGVISDRCQKENKAHALMIETEQIYKELWAKKYLEKRAIGGSPIEDIKAQLTVDVELVKLKHEGISAEINYRYLKERKDQAINKFETVKNLGYNYRKTIDGLQDAIKK